ncbi:peptidoglycan D,D-transpeptidase FtsI family protein [Desulfoscipio gibsoniae]
MLLIRQRRMVASFWLIVLAFGLILAHLYQIQLAQSYKYTRQAFQMGSQGVSLEQFPRGEITDRQGLSLTGAYYANRVTVIPALMDDKDLRLRQLAAILSVEAAQLQDRARQGAFYIDKTLSGNTCTVLQNAELPGVYLLPVYQRYGDEPLAVHVTGHIGKISSRDQLEQLQSTGKTYLLGDWVGQSGLEYFYEQQLKGTLARRWAGVPVDARGRVIQGPGMLVESADGDPGRLNVITTIDSRIQRIVEGIMNEHIASGAVVVMQAGSGDILGMASRPGYHPEYYRAVSNVDEMPEELFVDHCTALFQPGSVFKVVLAAAALEEGLVELSTVFNCTGAAARPVRCWNDAGHGRISFQQAFAQSCNPSFVEIGHRLGADTIIKYAAAFGLDKQKITGYPVPVDSRQDLSLIAKPHNLANSSVGQGPVLVTPVQVTAMINAIACGGNYYTPRLVAGLKDDSGRMVRQFGAEHSEPVVSPATAAQLRALLREVTESGVGQKAALPGAGSAGKTGSAQVSGYNGEKVDAWFTGYVPADNPHYVITVLVRSGNSGGDTAAPVFREIAARCLEIETGLDAE